MAFKTLIAAGLAAATLAFVPVSPAEAKTKIIIGIGTPGYGGDYCYYHPRRCGWAPRPYPYYAPYHRPVYLYEDYRYDRYDYRYDRRPVGKLTCGQARNIVDRSGFNKVRASECSGKVYTFRAVRKGHAYRVLVNAFNGRIVGTDRL